MPIAMSQFKHNEPEKRLRLRQQDEHTQLPPAKVMRRGNAAADLKKGAEIIGVDSRAGLVTAGAQARAASQGAKISTSDGAIMQKYGKRSPLPSHRPLPNATSFWGG